MKTIFKCKVDNRPFTGQVDTLHEARSMSEAIAFCTESKKNTGREYFITVDGIQYWNTESGENTANIQSL